MDGRELRPVSRPRSWLSDLPSSLVVFMVALPLCIAIAQACGVPAEAGIITGIVGGLVVGVIAGSPLQVSGPAAGLVVLVYQLREQFGASGMGIAIAIAGVFQLVAGAIKLGHWFRAVSPAVIHGMLAGIGIIILASQIHVLVDDVPSGKPLENIQSIPHAAWKAFNDRDIDYPHHRSAAAVGLLAIAVLVGWNALKPQRLKIIPGALVAVVVGSIAALADAARYSHGGGASESACRDQLDWQQRRFAVARPSGLAGCCNCRTHRQRRNAVVCRGRGSHAHRAAHRVQPRTGGPRRRQRHLRLSGRAAHDRRHRPQRANVNAGAKTRLSAILHGAWLLLFVTALLRRCSNSCRRRVSRPS